MMSNADQPSRQYKIRNAGAVVPWERVERFVGQVAHDLRNGLNACELQLTFLAEISTDPEASEEIKRLRRTVGDMTRQLQALRVATGAATLHPLEYLAGDLFEDLRERFQKLHADSSERVRWKAEVGNQLFVSVDPEWFLAAGLELIRNALCFASKDSPIVCSVSEEAGKVTYEIKHSLDEAPSTPLENWGEDPLVSTRRGAYGLGLFQVRRRVEAQAGELRFEYSGKEGTLAATISLPIMTLSHA